MQEQTRAKWQGELCISLARGRRCRSRPTFDPEMPIPSVLCCILRTKSMWQPVISTRVVVTGRHFQGQTESEEEINTVAGRVFPSLGIHPGGASLWSIPTACLHVGTSGPQLSLYLVLIALVFHSRSWGNLKALKAEAETFKVIDILFSYEATDKAQDNTKQRSKQCPQKSFFFTSEVLFFITRLSLGVFWGVP